jgi:DNA-binding GntR family transcriptional regulator
MMRSKIGTKVHRPKPLKGGPLRSGPRPRPAANIKTDDHLYLQVARALKEEIVRGVFPVGAQLPTEDELCERFSVSRYTVREALRRLREDNLVASRQGAGTVVVPRTSSDLYVQDVMSINDLLVFATGARFAIKSMEMVLMDEKLASRTGLASGEEWLTVCGFRQTEGAQFPVCWTEYYIHRQFAAVGRLLQRHTGPIFPLIEDLFGQSIVEVHQEIAATLISAVLAPGLKVEVGSAALEVRRTYKTSDGQVAQVTVNTHPASRFRHSMTMRRVRG